MRVCRCETKLVMFVLVVMLSSIVPVRGEALGGRVMNSYWWNGISGAAIYVNGSFVAYSDSLGYWLITGVSPGYYSVRASATGYLDEIEYNIYVQPNTERRVASVMDSMDLLTDSNNDGYINQSDEVIETNYVGRHVNNNDDDDNNNGVVDCAETGTVAGEDDLVPVYVSVGPGATGTVVFSHTACIKVWNSSTKGTELTAPISVASLPSTVWVEGWGSGDATLTATHKSSVAPYATVTEDMVRFYRIP